MELTLGEEAITSFRDALERVSALAHARLPQELHGHLERAHALVRHGHVWMDEDGRHAQVLSSDGTTWYVCNGHCPCMDATRAPQGLCKHRIAVGLYRRASELLHAAPRPLPLGEASAAPALPEAPASANARVVIDGHEVQVTLRDTDEERLLVRLATLLARYPAAACGGKGKGPAPAAAQPTPDGWCLIHNVQMPLQTNARGSWRSHRLADGTWCRGKAPQA